MLTDIINYFMGLSLSSPICTSWGAVFKFNKNLFALTIPDSPNNMLCLLPFGGGEPEMGHRDLMNPSLQIWIRNGSPLIAYNTGVSLITTLHKEQTLINGVCFASNSAPISVGLDDKGRASYSCNFSLKWIVE